MKYLNQLNSLLQRKYRDENTGDPDPGSSGGDPNAGDPNAGDPNAGSPPELVSLLGDEYKEAPSLQDFKSVDALAKGYVELKQYQGSSLRIPGEDASDEARDEFNQKLVDMGAVMLKPDFDNPDQSRDFYRSLGAPEDQEGYQLNMPDGIENLQVDNDRIALFREVALEHGLTKNQFSGIMDKILMSDLGEANANAEAATNAEATLRQEWGGAYDQNMGVAEAVARATGAPTEFLDSIAAGNMGPKMSQWLYSLANKFQGEGQNFIDRENVNYKESTLEIQEQIDEIMSNNKHPYWIAGHVDHNKAIQKMLGLQNKLHKN